MMTIGVATVSMPALAIPVVGEIGDLIMVVWLAYYWLTMFRDMGGPPPPVLGASSAATSSMPLSLSDDERRRK
jgi:hypothetical protein